MSYLERLYRDQKLNTSKGPLSKGNSSFMKGDYSAAVNNYSKVICDTKEIKDAYRNRGLSYLKLNYFGKAIEDFDVVIGKTGNDQAVLYSRSWCYFKLNKYDDAMKDLDKVIKISKEKNVTALNNRAAIFNLKQMFKKAVDDYSKIVKVDKKNYDAYYNRCLIYSRLKEYQKVIADSKMVISLTDKSHILSVMFYYQGLSYQKLKKTDEAIESYTKSLKYNDKQAIVYNNRALLYYKKLDYDNSESDFKKCIKLDPKNQKFKKNYKQFFH